MLMQEFHDLLCAKIAKNITEDHRWVFNKLERLAEFLVNIEENKEDIPKYLAQEVCPISLMPQVIRRNFVHSSTKTLSTRLDGTYHIPMELFLQHGLPTDLHKNLATKP